MEIILDKVFIRLDEALSQDPKARLKECSQTLGVTRHTVEKAVKATTGVSFREYQKQKILIEALRLLAEEGELSETEIAGRLGYKSAGAFERFIETETGSKPSDFRSLGVKTDQGVVYTADRVTLPEFFDPSRPASRSLPDLNPLDKLKI